MADDLLHEVTDGLGIVARFSCIDGPSGAEVRVVTPRLVLRREEAAHVLAAVEHETAEAPVVVLTSNDAVLREAARAAGYHGGLRADLVRDASPRPPVPASVAEWLPVTQVVERPASPPRRLTRFLSTGLDRMVRIEAGRAGVGCAVVVPWARTRCSSRSRPRSTPSSI